MIGYLPIVITLLAAAVLGVLFIQRFRISPILGYLVAGLVIGPSAFAIIEDSNVIKIFAEFGVIFLLFTIGLDLPFERIVSMRYYIFGLGVIQVFISSLIIGLASYYWGLSAAEALVVGGALALSSTAIVFQLLIENKGISQRFGRIAIAILLFQDISVVPLLTVLPMLTSTDISIYSALATAALKATVAFILIFLFGQLFVRPLYKILSILRIQELFAITTLLIVLTTAYLTELAGLSLALGAFMAGLILAGSHYRHQVEADIQPFRGLLLGLFFMSVGMMLDFRFIYNHIFLISILCMGLIVVKGVIIYILTRMFNLHPAVALRVGLLLSQGGEFSFVILSIAYGLDIVDSSLTNLLLSVVVVTMMLTPFLDKAGSWLEQHLYKSPIPKDTKKPMAYDEYSSHVIILGFGRVGQIIAKQLYEKSIPYLAFDNDPFLVRRMAKKKFPVFYGNGMQREVLQSAGITKAKAVLFTIDDTEKVEKMVRWVRNNFPDVGVYIRGYDQLQKHRLEAMDVEVVIPEILSPSQELGDKIIADISNRQN